MTRIRTSRDQMTILDALVALPLARFRTAIGRLTLEELAALQRRIEVLAVKERWALGSHGMARHRAPNALGRLARRLHETRRETEFRGARMAQLRLLEPQSTDRESIDADRADLAA